MFSRSFNPLLRSRIPITQRASLSTSTARWSQDSSSSSAYREGMARYKLFVSPFAKVFLGAIFTYQVIHWTWLKLEMDESKAEKNKEVEALEKKAKELTGAQK
ncbi:hypothetical protein BO85DRAFT_450601 [Aspergillus piperis CBS 112811]|nr:hypothetical protein BO85DRAFT_450601 [Aspergillus piperis CBS 112811]OJZ86291.1 hypothetical protein ASPFODRAFT_60299 [Aspergillus luchuensis CBS 106.47]RAH56575.1 hypothetical protein BO85DRAFT_450601 [Aspergillus piperis CBS 112811]GAA89369.1 similar to An16g08810 [Aspergillus luchuensis IFO 4308]GAT28982.1 similar to An16g08810 [Aspergillus luchuensis]